MTSRLAEHPEDLLIADAMSGDKTAFAELVRRHQGRVMSLATRLLSDPELAADVSQEALIKAWRALPSFRGEAAFSTWLHRITVNTAWTHRRRADRHRVYEIDPQVPGVEVGDPDHPESAGEISDLRRRLVVALDRLPAGSRVVVILKDVYGWTHTEIADALGITATATKVRLHRARLKLQEELEGLR